MLRFFEPELFSAATLDHRTPKQLGFAWESKLSDSRKDAIFPLLPSSSSSSSSSSLLRNNFETNNGARNSSIPQGLESLHSYSGGFLMSCEDWDGFQLNTFSSPAPSMNRVPGQASSMASNHAMDMKPSSQTNSKCNEMTGTRKQRKPRNVQTILRESKRQKGARDTKPQNPSFDELNQLQRAEGAPKKSQKLGDKITALQQLVSPFGKTDTASVLQEAGICIKVLHEQIRMMSSPYFPVQASPILLGNGGMELGLRERGLCLVPIPSTTEYLSNQEHIGPSVLERMRWEAGIRLPN